jgi:predicted acylesterase/phospholipase RssA
MRKRLLIALGSGLALLVACNFVATRQLASAFNEGVLDSVTDPMYPRSQRAEDTVMWRMRDELGEAYFGQGSDDARVVGWLRIAERAAPRFMEASLQSYFARDASFAEDDDEGDASDPSDKQFAPAQRRIERAIAQTSVRPPEGPICEGRTANRGNVEALADYVRFRVTLQGAVNESAKLVDERFATLDEATRGAQRAFGDTAAYLAHRTWRRDVEHRVSGLVVKGGAATGVFSAGVVWVALNVVDRCIAEGKCDPNKAGFALASGTSTGATIVGATDIFHTNLGDAAARRSALQRYLDWYLCSSMNDLYCVRGGSAFDLARGAGAKPKYVQDSMLDFNGLAAKIESNYGCAEMNNGMEVILNTVDFRTGRLYSLSDQDPATLRSPWDVSKAIVSSAALPFIVRPIYHLPVDPVADAGNFAYLDGGIRSELPLLALVRRGVERLLVVSSAASVTVDDRELPNGLEMAIRYIDVSTGGVTESELDHAVTRAEASRLAEYEYCRALLHERPALCSGACDADYLCSGDWERVCTHEPGRAHRQQNNDQLLRHTFQMTNLWRNEERVVALPGYAFNPVEQRRLMMAGAEAARQKCVQIASILGIEIGTGPRDVDEATLYRWCTRRLPTTDEQCPKEILEAAKKSEAPTCTAKGLSSNPDAGSEIECKRPR